MSHTIKVALALLVAAACTGPGRSPAPSAAQARVERHPVVEDPAETCAGCHAGVTPEIAQAYHDGRHGLAQVSCVVCHGSTGDDFHLRPAGASCDACHSQETHSVTLDRGRTRDCFTCHPPHELTPARGKSPHVAKGGRP
jgi:hypothetical protein